jgi:nicotinamidase-related amidase
MAQDADVDALIIVDAQEGLLIGDAAVPHADELVDRLQYLVGAARDAGSLIAYLQNDGRPGSLDEPGSAGWPIHHSLQPQPNDVVVRKTSDDGFDGTVLYQTLVTHAVRHVAIAGLLSEMCVSATARSALRQGLRVTLVTDAHATYDLDEIPSTTVSRVAEHALGDKILLVAVRAVQFGPRVADQDGGDILGRRVVPRQGRPCMSSDCEPPDPWTVGVDLSQPFGQPRSAWRRQGCGRRARSRPRPSRACWTP